jgi:hypothetical protein
MLTLQGLLAWLYGWHGACDVCNRGEWLSLDRLNVPLPTFQYLPLSSNAAREWCFALGIITRFAGKKIIYLSPIVEQVEPVGDGAADGALKSLASE